MKKTEGSQPKWLVKVLELSERLNRENGPEGGPQKEGIVPIKTTGRDSDG